jgi:hypothetical protein
VPVARIAESVDKVNELARPHNTNFQDEMVEQYGRVKRFLPALLRDLHFVLLLTVSIPWLLSITLPN